jgi:uronate dehydrogenase
MSVLPRAVLLTGAAGRIGRSLRATWQGRFAELRVADQMPLGEPGPGERAYTFDLCDFAATSSAVEGVDAVVHLAAIPDEDAFDGLVQANVVATYNVFEAARRNAVRRVVFASTNHVTGYYETDERVGPDDPVRPDSLYATTKVFGEALGRLYHDKWGLEVVAVRIGAFTERPTDPHGRSLWLSPRDAATLFTRALVAPDVGFVVVYGLSRIRDSFWDNPGAKTIGFEPVDEPEPAAEPSPRFQGGPFAEREYWVDFPAP